MPGGQFTSAPRHAATEAFFCGSGNDIQPILSIDRLPVGVGDPGPLTRAIQQRYFATVRGDVPQYRHGLTPVFGGA
jgi:branched-chain amino acid aminotransferase